MEVVCVVTGTDGLNADAVAVLTEALERAGCAAALTCGGPALRGAAPAAAGRNVALCACNVTAAAEVSLLYAPQSGTAPFDLRRWMLATKALAEQQAASAMRAAPLPAGSHGSLRALAALLEAGAPSAWVGSSPMSQGGTHHVTVVCAAPTAHVDEDLITSALMDADGAHMLVHFVFVKPSSPLSIQDELASTRACGSFLDVVALSDNGTGVIVDATPAAMQSLALGLLLRERTPAGVPRVLGVLNMPAPLTAGGPRCVRLRLRPGVLPLHDIVEPVKVCRCHGRGVLCTDATIGADDVAHFLRLADKNNVCSVNAKRLEEREWVPNCVCVGRDSYICLPSFFQPQFLERRANANVVFSAHCTVALSSVTEAHMFGLPWVAAAPDDDAEELAGGAVGGPHTFGFDADDAIIAAALAPGSASASAMSADTTASEANAMHLAALVVALSRNDLGLVLSCGHNLDQGQPTPFKCFYLAQAPHDAVSGDAANTAATLLLRRIAGREELLPASHMDEAHITMGDVPAALETEVAACLANTLPLRTAYEPLQYERGVHRVVSALVSRSMAPPTPSPQEHKKSAARVSGQKKPSKRNA